MRIRTQQSQAGLPRNTLRHLIRGPQRPDRLSLADVMTDRQSDGDIVQEVDHEAEMALVRRLEILERLVYGRSMSRFTDRREGAEALGARVEAIAKDVAIAEGGDNRDIAKLAEQASGLGFLHPLLSHGPSAATPPVVESIESSTPIKESIVLGAREEIGSTASALAQVKSLQQHVNPPFLRDIPQWSARLSRLEGTYLRQATEAAWITERAEETLLHYSKAIHLVSEKFVRWDDQVAQLEHNRASGPLEGADTSGA